MIPVKQQFRHDPERGVWGDCHRACLASLLGFEIEEVPHFYEKGRAANPNIVREYLESLGLADAHMVFPGDLPLSHLLATMKNLNPGIHYILGGTSKNQVGHSVIAYEDEIVHDPSLDNSGIIGPMEDGHWWVTFLVAKDMGKLLG